MGHGFWTPYILFVCLETSVNYWCFYQKQHQQPVITQWAYSYHVEGQPYNTILYEGFEHVQIIVLWGFLDSIPCILPIKAWWSGHVFSLYSLRFTGVLAAKSLAPAEFLATQSPKVSLSYPVNLIQFNWFFKKIFIFVYLTVLSCSTQDLCCCMWTLSCSIWDLVPWPGIEPRLPTLGVQSLSHWTTREVPVQLILRIYMQDFWEYIPVKFLLLGFVAPDFVCDGSLLVQDSRRSC